VAEACTSPPLASAQNAVETHEGLPPTVCVSAVHAVSEKGSGFAALASPPRLYSQTYHTRWRYNRWTTNKYSDDASNYIACRWLASVEDACLQGFWRV